LPGGKPFIAGRRTLGSRRETKNQMSSEGANLKSRIIFLSFLLTAKIVGKGKGLDIEKEWGSAKNRNKSWIRSQKKKESRCYGLGEGDVSNRGRGGRKGGKPIASRQEKRI